MDRICSLDGVKCVNRAGWRGISPSYQNFIILHHLELEAVWRIGKEDELSALCAPPILVAYGLRTFVGENLHCTFRFCRYQKER